MRRTMYFGGIPVDLEANLGTAVLFQEFTGKNLLEASSLLTKQIKGIDLTGIKPTTKAEDLAQNKNFLNNIGDLSTTAEQMADIAKRLAYVMKTQAQFGKTKEDISKIRQLLTEDDLLAWSFNFDPTAFTAGSYKELMEFWRDQSQRMTTPKNA